MNNFYLISFLEAIYVIYILNFFKTKYSLAHPLTYFDNEILYHPIGKSNKPISNICRLGNIGAYFIAFYIILRVLFNKKYKIFESTNIIVVFIVFVMSLLNFNAVVYLLPYFCIEYLVINGKLK